MHTRRRKDLEQSNERFEERSRTNTIVAVLCDLATPDPYRRTHWQAIVRNSGNRLNDRRRYNHAEHYWSARGHSAGFCRIPVIGAVNFLATAKSTLHARALAPKRG